ncbi:Phosphotransferase enzyme family protein [Streptomyces sp. cf124]|nr:Phosphotransferase enzyme family protein [Streptomyces sp. cf124]
MRVNIAFRPAKGSGRPEEAPAAAASVIPMTNDGAKPDARDDGDVLPGGTVNAGAVVRRGSLVDRPAPPTAPALHAHLRALRRRGFTGAPLPVGRTPDGREQLTFVPGDVALPPFPAWALTEPALTSVGRLLRGLHAASADIPVDTCAAWPRELSDPEGGPILCHNDVCPDNVVFRDGRATALIDFDLAAPGRPVWDVAMAARYWVPLLDPESAAALYPGGPLDAPRRLRVLADGYGLSSADRALLPAVVQQATEACRAFVAVRVAGGDPVYRRVLAERGGWARWDRVRTWLRTHEEAFTTALLA